MIKWGHFTYLFIFYLYNLENITRNIHIHKTIDDQFADMEGGNQGNVDHQHGGNNNNNDINEEQMAISLALVGVLGVAGAGTAGGMCRFV